MGADGVFPAEMPDHPFPPIAPLDADTAERLLAGRLDPDDAPPGYAEVAQLLRAAAAPACPDELAGQAAALAAFRTAHRHRPARPRGRPFRLRGRRSRPRGRLVAVALAGALAAGGLWIADGARITGELRSPSGGPGAGGSGSGASEVLRSARPSSAPVTVPTRVTGGRPMVLPAVRDRATAHHGGGSTSRGGGSAHGAKPARPGKPPKSKPGKAKPDKDEKRQTGNRN